MSFDSLRERVGGRAPRRRPATGGLARSVRRFEDDLRRSRGLRDHQDVRRLDLSILACARFAMNICVAGGIAWSSVETRYQEGIVFHAGSADGEPNASCEKGRCSAHIRSACFFGTSLANAVSNPFLVR